MDRLAIDTPLTVSARRDFPGLDDFVLDRTPVGRWGVPADFAGAAVFLASKASDFITGEFIKVDGGFAQGTLTVHPSARKQPGLVAASPTGYRYYFLNGTVPHAVYPVVYVDDQGGVVGHDFQTLTQV